MTNLKCIIHETYMFSVSYLFLIRWQRLLKKTKRCTPISTPCMMYCATVIRFYADKIVFVNLSLRSCQIERRPRTRCGHNAFRDNCIILRFEQTHDIWNASKEKKKTEEILNIDDVNVVLKQRPPLCLWRKEFVVLGLAMLGFEWKWNNWRWCLLFT